VDNPQAFLEQVSDTALILADWPERRNETIVPVPKRCARTGGAQNASRKMCETNSYRADYWLHCTIPRHRLFKRRVAFWFRGCDKLFDTIPALNVDVALRKQA
jgi:hypothetical protein